MLDDLNASLDAYKKNYKYDFDNEIMLNYYPSRILEKLNSGSILELGLGHGYTAKKIMAMTDSYTVLEGAELIIEKFYSENPSLKNKIQILHTYFEDFETDKKYDNIVMGFILEHVDDPEFIVEKYLKYLPKGGKLFVAVPNSESLHRRVGFEAGFLSDLAFLSKYDHELGHKRYFNAQQIQSYAKKFPLKLVSLEGIFLKPITTGQIQLLNMSKEILEAFLKVGISYPELSNAILAEYVHI